MFCFGEIIHRIHALLVISLQGKWRATMFDLVNSAKFEMAVMLLILANMIVMMIRHHGQSEEISKALHILFQ